MPDPTIVVHGRGDFTRLNRDLTSSASSINRWGDRARRAGRVAAIGLTAGAVVAAAAIAKVTTAAAQDEQQQILLAGALKRNAQATDAQVAATERWITAQGKALGVTDDELRPALSQLVTATKDVERAQFLASLAMDTAAAKGKSLESISTALMKAENGQVSALQRLGVNTKNAAGETLTMDQVTRRMAETFGGAAAEKANTLQGRLDRVKVMASETGEAIGARLLPPLTDLAVQGLQGARALGRFAETNIGPKLEDLAGFIRDNADEVRDLVVELGGDLLPLLKEGGELASDAGEGFVKFAIPIAQDLVPALGDLLGIGADVLGFVNDLPGPVKEIGVQAGIAALVLPRLAGAVGGVTASMSLGIARARQFQAELTYTATRAQAASAAMSRLGGAAKAAAGVGGMVLLAQGASQANQSLGFLASTAGGALLGFSLGGPVGAAIGAGAGALWGLASATKGSAVEMVEAEDSTKAYIDTLNELTAATTVATRERIKARLTENTFGGAEAIDNLTRLGVSMRDMIGATLGNAGAMDRLKQTHAAAVEQYAALEGRVGETAASESKRGKALLDLAYNLNNLFPALENEGRLLRQNAKAARQNALDTQSLRKVYAGVPSKVITEIRQLGGDVSMREARGLIRQYKLTPKQVATIFRANNINQTDAQIRRLVARINEARRTKGDMPNLAPGVKRSADQAGREADRGANALKRLLEGPLKKVKGDLPNLPPGIRAATRTAAGIATSGGNQVGNNLESGIISGFAGTQARLAAAAAAAVRAAVAAAKAAARSKSPSKETQEIGRDLGLGLELGLRQRQGNVRDEGRDLVRSLLAGVTSGSQGVSTALDKITALIEKQVKLKDDKAETRREREILRGLKNQYAALKQNGKAQDANNRLLDAAREKWSQLRDESTAYAASIRDSFVQFGNVVGLGANQETGAVSLTELVEQMRKRVEQAKRFANLIRLLSSPQYGLNATTLQQLLAAGPEAALATAEAIASGGKSAVTEINHLASQLASAGGSLGTQMSGAFFGAGVKAAEGVVKGLERQQAQLDKVAERLARTIARELREQLSIADTHSRRRLDMPASRKAAGQPTADPQVNQLIAEVVDMKRILNGSPERTGKAAGDAVGEKLKSAASAGVQGRGK